MQRLASSSSSSSARLLECARWAAFSAVLLTACGASLGSGDAEWPPLAKQWFDRADASFRQGDMEDARLAIENALKVVPDREGARVLSAKVALADLEYDRAIAAVSGIETTEARSVRGRAHWYAGNVERAADELERMLSDPDVRDPWATEIAKLARIGVGRKPFEISGGLVAVTEMPKAGTTSLIVPLELNGELALGMIATGTAEAVIDSSAGARPSWVSLRIGERFEVRNVPALAKDLSGISRQVNAPIKILLGVNLLRRLRPTFDFAGGQFVVRSFDPPPPPIATMVRLSYIRGGGMLLRGAFGSDPSSPTCALLVDTALAYPVALDLAGWKKAGVSPSKLVPVPGMRDLRQGVLPMLRLGAFDVPQVPGLQGDSAVKEREEGLGIEIDGLLGSGLLASFRVTLADGGRSMWLEDMPAGALNGPPLFPAESPEGAGEEPIEEEAVEPEAPAAPGKGVPTPRIQKGTAPGAPAKPQAPKSSSPSSMTGPASNAPPRAAGGNP